MIINMLDKFTPAAPWGLALVAGLLAALSFPDFNVWPAAWVCLAPLLLALEGAPPGRAFGLGFSMGAACFGLTIPWFVNTMVDFGHMPPWLAWTVTGLAVSYLSFFTGAFGVAVGALWRRAGAEWALVAAPFWWLALELARGHMPPLAFPWARLADSQFRVLPVIQIADITGEEGVGFLLAFTGAALARMILWARGRGAGERYPWRWLALWLLFTGGAVAYGAAALDTWSRPAGEPVKVAVVQGDIDQNRKWDHDYVLDQLAIYEEDTRTAAAAGARFVVWPETAAAFHFGEGSWLDGRIMALARELNISLLFGAPGTGVVEGERVSYNRAWMVRPDGAREKYDKVHLVPFGEYVPMSRALFFVRKMAHSIGDMLPGERAHNLDAGGFSAGPQICFEVIFPRYTRQQAARGAGVIANITNDAWFGRSAMSDQSLATAVFRAVENRIPLVRAAQSGVSAIVQPTGEITGATELFTRATLAGSVVPRTGALTPYTSSGGAFAWMTMAGALLISLLAWRARRP